MAIRTLDLQSFVESNAKPPKRRSVADPDAVAQGIAARDPYGTARLSEAVLARDWLTPEEDERWAHL